MFWTLASCTPLQHCTYTCAYTFFPPFLVVALTLPDAAASRSLLWAAAEREPAPPSPPPTLFSYLAASSVALFFFCYGRCGYVCACVCVCVFRFRFVFEQSSSGSASTRNTSPMGSRRVSSQKMTHEDTVDAREDEAARTRHARCMISEPQRAAEPQLAPAKRDTEGKRRVKTRRRDWADRHRARRNGTAV